MSFMMSSACEEVTSSSAIPSSISISASPSSSSPSALHNSLHGPNPSANHSQIDRPLSKKKRNLPGNPDPDAEVIALSPKSLMATNRFMCEICNKGFQRDQNLQLHRRGHNLPWKLKQRVNEEAIRKKVYVCPELGCVHHDRSRALGDLTGIKKHYSRKHGEKKWKCDKCSKRYAVQSDWKAHSKVCGTREYRCDCGTLFSRRDSFITHRAFCDALAEESARSTTIPNPIIQNPQFNPQLQHPQFMSLKHEEQHLGTTAAAAAAATTTTPWLSSLPLPPVFPTGLDHGLSQNYVNPEMGPGLDPMIFTTSQFHQFTTALPSSNMSATALLQKAVQMGATMTSCASLQDVIMPLSYGNDTFGGMFGSIKDETSTHVTPKPLGPGGSAGQNGKGDMTRDFLGLRPVSCGDILNIAGIESCIKEQQEQEEHQEQEIQKPWLGN